MEWITTTRILEELKSSKDGDAWTVFIRNFRPVLVKFGRRMGLSKADAEDACQQTLLAFVQGLRAGRYVREKGRLSGWLFGVAKRVIQKNIASRSSASGVGPRW